MRERERIKFQKHIWAAIEFMVVGETKGRWHYYRRGTEPIKGFTFDKKGELNDWSATDDTAPKGWQLMITINGHREIRKGEDTTRFDFTIWTRAHYVKYGQAGSGFYTAKKFTVLADGSDLDDQVALLRAFILRRRRRVRHTAKQSKED